MNTKENEVIGVANEKTRKLVWVSDRKKLDDNGILFSSKMLRKWHHLGNYPDIFMKFSKKLFVDVIKYWELIDAIVSEKKIKYEKLNKRLAELNY